MKTNENKDVYSTPDYERMTFETSGLAQMSDEGGTGTGEVNEDEDHDVPDQSSGGVNLFRP